MLGQDNDHGEGPVTVLGVKEARDVASGMSGSCAIVGGGRVLCWETGTSPMAVPAAGVNGATDIAVTWDASCAVVSGGRVVCWRGDGSEPVFVPGVTGARTLAAWGPSGELGHMCAVVDGGQVMCWGANESGQLGNGSVTELGDVTAPVRVVGITGATALAVEGSLDYEAAHSCAMVAGGHVKCWGSNSYGELGDGTTSGQSTPVGVVGLE